jgi:hypothetical protein
VPADWNVKLNRSPGAIDPELHIPALPVDVCVVLSLFTQLTVVPGVMLIGFGEYAVLVIVDAPLTMATVLVEAESVGVAVGVGVGVVGVGEVLPPHAVARRTTTSAKIIRTDMCLLSDDAEANSLPPRRVPVVRICSAARTAVFT